MKDIAELIAAVKSADTAVAEPASRELRNVARVDPMSLSAWRKDLLKLAMSVEDLRVRWNLIIVLGMLPLTSSQRAVAVDWLFERLRDPGSLTRTHALQALVDLSAGDAALRRRLLPIAQEFAETGTAAMRARARKLLKQMQG